MSATHILIVDDNAINLKLVSRILRLDGYTLSTAISAEDALKVISEAPPNLILMDIALPGMDGLTLTRQLKSSPATSHIPIIALTAYAMKGDDEKAFAAGCDGYITKPIDVKAFPKQVLGWLHKNTSTP